MGHVAAPGRRRIAAFAAGCSDPVVLAAADATLPG